MKKQQLIDACGLKRDISKLPITSSWWEAFVKNLIDEQPIVDPETIIDPETLPIVQELRKKLSCMTVERDKYKELFLSYRHVCEVMLGNEEIEELMN